MSFSDHNSVVYTLVVLLLLSLWEELSSLFMYRCLHTNSLLVNNCLRVISRDYIHYCVFVVAVFVVLLA